MSEIPYGFCHCGCGQRTGIAKWTRSDRGWVAGKPKRFIYPHASTSGSDYEVDPETGCWVWLKSRSELGYGRMNRRGTVYYAHRVYYERHKGPIPKGLCIDHLCRNPPCVNPDHLEAVTNAENCRRGDKARLTLVDVEYIRGSAETTIELGSRFGVDPAHISRIKTGVRWDA